MTDPRMIEPSAAALHQDIVATTAVNDWQPLPPRGAKLAALSGFMGFAIPCATVAGVTAAVSHRATPWLAATVIGLLAGAFGAWMAVRRHRRTRWKLDALGFALQRGRLWQTESRVPVSRVQHLDLKRGPLQRAAGLATLVIHTAGTRMAAVTVNGLDGNDAEHLRDHLARQLDQDDDAL